MPSLNIEPRQTGKTTKLWHELWQKQAPGLTFERFKELAMQGIFAKPGRVTAKDFPPMNIGHTSMNNYPISDLIEDDHIPWSNRLNRRLF